MDASVNKDHGQNPRDWEVGFAQDHGGSSPGALHDEAMKGLIEFQGRVHPHGKKVSDEVHELVA